MNYQAAPAEKSSKVCSLCHSSTILKYQAHPGYQQPTEYDIYHCEHCNTSFADPHCVDEQLYNMIYSRSLLIPSYRRYATYAQAVLQQRDPLVYLAHSEDMYWGVYQVIARNDSSTLNVLDIGSGLGYLTYALNHHGIKTRGIDISEEAVAKSQQLYGDYFICDNIYEYAQKSPEHYSLIVMCEVIEHVEDIVSFLQVADTLLAPGGSLVITTPNKSLYPASIIWHTAPPPVHLWWLSEESFTSLAENFGYAAEFIDYAVFNTAYGATNIPNHKPNVPTRSYVLDPHGDLYVQPGFKHRIKSWLKEVHIYDMLQKYKNGLLARFRSTNQQQSRRRGTLCVVLTKPIK